MCIYSQEIIYIPRELLVGIFGFFNPSPEQFGGHPIKDSELIKPYLRR